MTLLAAFVRASATRFGSSRPCSFDRMPGQIFWRRVAPLLAMLGAVGPVLGQEEDNPPDQMGVTMEAANSGQSMQGEFIEPLTGRVTHEVTELVLPGNGGIDIRITRAFGKTPSYQRFTPFAAAAWDIVVPRVSLTFPASPAWCEDPETYVSAGLWGFAKMPGTGITLSLPGDQPRSLIETGSAPRYLTADSWKADCIPADNVANKGFKVTSPAGVSYYFDVTFIDTSYQYGTAKYTDSFGTEQTAVYPAYIAVQLVPSRVEDRFGNYLAYEYVQDPNGRRHVSRITASDGREVTFGYHDAGKWWRSGKSVFLIDWFSSAGRMWTFQYEGAHLKSVTRPDGTKHEYTYGGHAYNDAAGNYLATAKYPNGATLTYTAVKRTFSGSKVWGISSRTWSDSQSSNAASYAYSSAGTGLQFTTVTSSTRTERLTVDNSSGAFRGRVKNSEIFSPLGIKVEEVSYGFQALRDLGEAHLHTGLSWSPAKASAENLVVPIVRTITRSSDVFTTTLSDHDAFGQPQQMQETEPNNALYTRVTRFDYLNDQTLWVIGQMASKRVARAINGSEALPFYQTDAATFDSLARPEQIWKNGLRVETRGYDSQGNLAWKDDGLNRRTRYLDYYRGAPRQTIFADQTYTSQSLNYFGEQTSFTDERGNTTGYQRDELGRIKQVDYPSGDVQAWAPRVTTRGFITAQTLGHPIGTWREITTEGNLETWIFFDGRGKPIQVRERDTATGLIRSRRFQYDERARKTFETDWSESDLSTGSGTYTDYDALDRVVGRRRSNGIMLEGIEYLDGMRKRLTDADGKVTTITFQAFGEPDYSRPKLIEAPEGQTTTISRDHFGKITSVTQSGPYEGSTVTATRVFQYDANQRLCRRQDPESGSTLWGYDAASQISWEAKGQSHTECVSQAPTDAVVFQYDARGRKGADTYPSGAENVAYGYDDAGNVESVSNATATWTYGYNKRNMLEFESASIDGKTFLLDHVYNAAARVAALITPARRTDYSPDAWGRPRVVNGYTGPIDYHPNNLPRAYSLANGLTYSLTLNDRQWPDVQSTKQGSTPIQQFEYSYSDAGDLLFLDSQAENSDDVTLTYDDLHRLETASGPLWGTWTYVYDPLNNLRARIGPSALTYSYDTFNRLASISGSAGRTYSYNSRGEITADGTRSFSINQRGQIVALAGGTTYAYDGNGKRIKTVQASGAIEYALYDKAGNLVYSKRALPPPVRVDWLNAQSPINEDEYTYLSWGSTGAVLCSASGTLPGWAGSKAVDGSQGIYISEPGQYMATLTCKDGLDRTSSFSVAVQVNDCLVPLETCVAPPVPLPVTSPLDDLSPIDPPVDPVGTVLRALCEADPALCNLEDPPEDPVATVFSTLCYLNPLLCVPSDPVAAVQQTVAEFCAANPDVCYPGTPSDPVATLQQAIANFCGQNPQVCDPETPPVDPVGAIQQAVAQLCGQYPTVCNPQPPPVDPLGTIQEAVANFCAQNPSVCNPQPPPVDPVGTIQQAVAQFCAQNPAVCNPEPPDPVALICSQNPWTCSYVAELQQAVAACRQNPRDCSIPQVVPPVEDPPEQICLNNPKLPQALQGVCLGPGQLVTLIKSIVQNPCGAHTVGSVTVNMQPLCDSLPNPPLDSMNAAASPIDPCDLIESCVRIPDVPDVPDVESPLAPMTPTDPTPGSTSAPGPVLTTAQVTMRWTASVGATRYYVSAINRATGVLATSAYTTSTSYTAAFDESKAYSWAVRACNDSGCSPNTATQYFKTPALESQTDYVRLNGQTIAETKWVSGNALVTYLHADLLGSPRRATDSRLSTLWREHYDPYGKKLSGVAEKVGYTGHAYDTESGLTYMQSRFYDAEVGRFLSSDPVHFTDDNPFTFNRYSYANNNPYRYTDPNGELAFLAPMLIGGGIGAVTSVIVQTVANGGDITQISFGQVGLAFVTGALGGASAVIANTAQTAGRAVVAQSVAAASIGATSVVASNGVAGVPTSVGDVVAGGVVNAVAAGTAARITNSGRMAYEAMSGTERVAAGNLRDAFTNATESAGGRFDYGAAATSTANVIGETISNLPNLVPPPPPPPPVNPTR